MQKAYVNLIKFALKSGHTVSVYDGEEWQVKRSQKFEDINAAVRSVDEAQIRIRDNDGKILGTALVSDAFDFEPDETVMDYTVTDLMNAWEAQYSNK